MWFNPEGASAGEQGLWEPVEGVRVVEVVTHFPGWMENLPVGLSARTSIPNGPAARGLNSPRLWRGLETRPQLALAAAQQGAAPIPCLPGGPPRPQHSGGAEPLRCPG